VYPVCNPLLACRCGEVVVCLLKSMGELIDRLELPTVTLRSANGSPDLFIVFA
jgi:hypothetical protein